MVVAALEEGGGDVAKGLKLFLKLSGVTSIHYPGLLTRHIDI